MGEKKQIQINQNLSVYVTDPTPAGDATLAQIKALVEVLRTQAADVTFRSERNEHVVVDYSRQLAAQQSMLGHILGGNVAGALG